MSLLRLPMLRAGEPYFSLKTMTLTDIRDGSPVAEVSQAIPGIIARDLLRIADSRRALEALPVARLLAICREAGRRFLEDTLPVGEQEQTPDDYLEQLAATTGMPVVMGRLNMGKIFKVLDEMEAVLDGLTRGLDLRVLDHGWAVQNERQLSYMRLSDALGAVLPNNSPGVHSLWLPAIPLRTPLVLKPGSAEPWTPLRIAQAMIAAGCPKEAFFLYPTDHGGATELLLRSGRSLFFGDASTVAGWRASGKVQVHGPGWSKVILAADQADAWEQHLDLMVGSITANGGRSCINASGVWTTAHGRELAAALASRLAAIEARPLDDPQAALAAFPDPEVARRISERIDQQLAETPGAVDLTAAVRGAERVAEAGGCTFLLPTVIWCEDPTHPLAHSEYGFPFAAVVEQPEKLLVQAIGPTLVGSVVTATEEGERRFLACRHIDRLNFGAIPTYEISWDQPHEGNLFDHLYQQRAFQRRSA